MARPNKRQLAARKEAKRYARLERGYRLTPLLALADFAVIVCESCGQEQATWTCQADLDEELQSTLCITCGALYARTTASHETFLAEAQALLLAVA